MKARLNDIIKKIEHGMLRDQYQLHKQIKNLQQLATHGKLSLAQVSQLEKKMSQSIEQFDMRQANKPVCQYPDNLPVIEKKQEIIATLSAHPVVIVCGETGSGKTTQLPKICLEMGRGIRGMIGHTQPRRVAARSVATRIASELEVSLGHAVGYKVRFSDKTSEQTYIKIMTDGILLAETQSDKWLEQYDTIIIDEAHERSLNIDFLLGYLKQIIHKRRDFKVIITSATIETERFSKHFDDAPIIEISGRTYPVDIDYQPLSGDDDNERDNHVQQGIIDAVDELVRYGPGDILIFLSGEREIRETAEVLRKCHPSETEILPMYARLSAKEQQRIFESHRGRRIVLATNVAETSLTVPGIRYVIDPGFARISRYSYRTKIQRLPIERISQASANQRSGRCGRVSAGVCIRLYSEEDYQARIEYTEPEILRTNLAAVILQMLHLGLGEIEQFPFIERPDQRSIKDGYKLLHELGAVDETNRLTSVGKQLAKIPIDPKLGRMIIAAMKENCLHEILIITSVLSIQDPRERPLDEQKKSDEKHRRFADEHSDFMTLLNLWEYLQEQSRHLTQNKFRKLCKSEYLSYIRIKEWWDVYKQLKAHCIAAGIRLNEQVGDYHSIHCALLSGLLAQIGCKNDDQTYLGTRGLKLSIFPGSVLFKKPPKWLVAAEILETARVYARTVAKIEPMWIEQLAPHLVKRSYYDAHWEKRPAQVAAYERVSLYGLSLVAKRKVNYGPIDPSVARDIFIKRALVDGEFFTRAAFMQHNKSMIEKIKNLEAKVRRQDILVDDVIIYQFFDERLPEGIYSGAGFDTWRKNKEKEHTRYLFIDKESLVRVSSDHSLEEQFPDHLAVDQAVFPLNYHFEPGKDSDGVTAKIPIAMLNQVEKNHFDWLVPGLIEEKITLLLKSLPKQFRKNFVPIPQFAKQCTQQLNSMDDSLLESLTCYIKKTKGIDIPGDSWQLETMPSYLFMRYEIVDEKNKILAIDRDLNKLRMALGGRAQAVFQTLPKTVWQRENILAWDFGNIPEHIDFVQQGMSIKGYPVLLDRQNSVSLTVMDNKDDARVLHKKGVRRLLMLSIAKQAKYLTRNLMHIDQLCLQYNGIGACDSLKEDLLDAVFDQVFQLKILDIRQQDEFEKKLATRQDKLISEANEYCKIIGQVLMEYRHLMQQMNKNKSRVASDAWQDINDQLAYLIYDGFVVETDKTWLLRLPVYLRAINKRIEKFSQTPERDQSQRLQLSPLWEHCKAHLGKKSLKNITNLEFEKFRWMIEEMRVSFFAQELKTCFPISIKRLKDQWDKVSKNYPGQPG